LLYREVSSILEEFTTSFVAIFSISQLHLIFKTWSVKIYSICFFWILDRIIFFKEWRDNNKSNIG